MRSRDHLLSLALLLMVIVTCWAVTLSPPSVRRASRVPVARADQPVEEILDRPSRASFSRVKVGMTRAEVESTVGAPPGQYGRGWNWWGPSGLHFYNHEGWLAPDAELRVRFDKEGRADAVVLLPGFPRR